MWEWFWYALPWEFKLGLFAVIAASILLMAVMIFGYERVRRFILPALGLVAVFGLWNKSQREGWLAREKKEMEIANKHIERARKARERADRDNADPERLRDDDGYKRH